MRVIGAALLSLPVLILCTACSSFTPRSGPEGADGLPGVDPLPGPEATGSPDHGRPAISQAEIRTACRTEPRPRGWIAIAYEQLGEQCPERKGDNGYNGVRLQQYADRAPGTMLIVCADQTTPNGWVRQSAPDDARCPGARVDQGEPTARAIVRVR